MNVQQKQTAKTPAQRLAEAKSRLSSIKAQLDARQRHIATGTRVSALGGAIASLPREAGGSGGATGRAGLLRANLERRKMGSIGNNGPTATGNVRASPVMKSIASNIVKQIPFRAGKTVQSAKLSHEGQRKQAGTVHMQVHEGRLPQAAFSYKSKQFLDSEGEIVTGTEYMYQAQGVATTTTSKNGCPIRIQQLNPQFFRNTKLFQRSILYNRFRFRKVIFEYEPAVSSTVGGDLIMSITLDGTEATFWETPSGDAAIRRMKGYNNTVTFNTYANASCHIEFNEGSDWFYLGASEDPRFESQGQWFLQEGLAPATLSAAGVNYGLVTVHYEVEFCGELTDFALQTVEQNATLQINSNATPTVANSPIRCFFTAAGGTQNAVYIPGTALIGNPGVVEVRFLTDTAGGSMGTWNVPPLTAALAKTPQAGLIVYAKATSAAGEYRLFNRLPPLTGDAALDDGALLWQGLASAGTSNTVALRQIYDAGDPQ